MLEDPSLTPIPPKRTEKLKSLPDRISKTPGVCSIGHSTLPPPLCHITVLEAQNLLAHGTFPGLTARCSATLQQRL